MPTRREPHRSWYPPASRPRPVEGGIRARSRRGPIGETWWSRRFLDLLEALGVGGRLDSGRRYARQGQVISLHVEGGIVTANVQGSRARPYQVRIVVSGLDEAQWRRVEAALAARALFAAKLLAGEMPREIEEAFSDSGLTLFPVSGRELRSSCSCPDWANPCKHVAAVYYLLGEAFDDDPFLIFRWRGRDRQQLLDNLRALRGGTGLDAGTFEDPWAEAEAVPAVDLDAVAETFWQAGDVAAPLRWGHGRDAVADAVLRELDDLDRTVAGEALVERVRPAYSALVATARRRLLGEDAG